ncbi:MAG: right-handed parallel beta-helix repeat-containing protein [Candidatus Bathyarchaeota archaeon]|nr:MAG: right-handed parallel beta-helix repeat-containing protein [Candidatus Bathyarchaeota archaeon]
MCFVLCFVLVSGPVVRIVNARPSTLVVPDVYSTIQNAIDNADDGDIVYVKSGEYLEYLVVDKSVSLVGENKETTIVYRRDQAYPDVYPTILVRADNVNITGFTIRNNVSAPSLIPSGAVNSHSAVHLLNVKDCNLVGNIIIDSGYGVWLFDASENKVSGNLIMNCAHGILVDKSLNNTIVENTISGSSNGILLSSSGCNTLRKNSILNSSHNFGVTGSELSHFMNDVDASNTINNSEIYYLVNKKNLIIDPVTFPDLAALILVNCTDIKVQNLNITNNYCGLHLFNVTSCTIAQNIFSNNNGGIWLQFVSDCVISENNVVANADWGIRVENSQDILITGNNSTYNQLLSIMLVNSDNNTIVDNNVTNFRFNQNNGGEKPFYLESSNNNCIINNQIFDDRGLHGISLIDSSYNLLSSNNVTIGGPGIDIRGASCYNKIVSNNFTTDRGSYGVSLFSSFNTFIGNYIYNFSNGFHSSHSSHNLITENTIESKSASFYFYNFSNNQIYHNNIQGQRVWDLGRDQPGRIVSVNQWDNGIEGNYWSDYAVNGTDGFGIGEQSYFIDDDNQDNYPLISPVKVFDAGLWEGTPYTVSVISNSSVSDFSFIPDGKINFKVECETGTAGFCRVTIPKDLLDAEENSWSVLVNDDLVTPTINMDTKNTLLNFTYSHNVTTIKITGTTAIPEFLSWILVPLFLALTLAICLCKKKLFITTVWQSN